MPLDLGRAYYDLLWAKYLQAHPDLVAYAATFDAFHDPFARPRQANQAESIRQYVKAGREAVFERPDVQALVRLLRGPRS